VIRVVGGLAVALSLLLAASASAHTSDFLSEFGTAYVNGEISPGEYDKDGCVGPVSQTAGAISYQLTVCEENDTLNDYWAVQITDQTNTGQTTDSPVIWFDNDHNGTVTPSSFPCTYGQPVEDKIGWDPSAFFVDGLYCFGDGSLLETADAKDPPDGLGQQKFASGPGSVFEFSHSLDSGDPDDYSLAAHDTVGWCLTYDDQSNSLPANPGFAFGEIQYPAGCFIDFTTQTLGLARGDSTLLGDVYKQSPLDEAFEKLKEKLRQFVLACKRCPPDPKAKLLDKVNEAIKELVKQQKGMALKTLKSFDKLTHSFVASGELPAGKGKQFLKGAKSPISLIKGFKNPQPVPTAPIAGGQHVNPVRVLANGQLPGPRGT
jgi:hypothetical protein